MLCLQLSEVAYKSSELSSGLRGIKQNSKTQHSAKLVPFILLGVRIQCLGLENFEVHTQ